MLDTAPVSTQRAATSLDVGALPEGKLEYLPLSELNFYDEEHYGRKLDERRANILRADWDDQKAGTIYVSRRPNPNRMHSTPVLYVIDGHHRVTVAREKGRAMFPALVWEGLSVRQEAALYAAFGSVLRQSAMQVFRARLAAGDEQAQHLNQCVTDAGFELNYTSHRMHPERLANVAMLERFYRLHGTQHLWNTLRLDATLFPGEPRRTRDYVIRALSMLQRYYPEFDIDRLARRVSEEGFLSLMSQGNGIAHTLNVAGHHGFGEALIRAYNKYGGHTLTRWSERVPLKDYSPTGRVALQANARKVNARKNGAKIKRTPAKSKVNHPAKARRRYPVWNTAIDEQAGRPD